MKTKIWNRINNWWNDDSLEVEYISGEQHFVKKNDNATENNLHKKSFSLKLEPEKKERIASNIIENSNVDILYRVQLIISCMLATLGLLSNSIPVII